MVLGNLGVKFVLFGSLVGGLHRGKSVAIYLDFSPLFPQKCGEADFIEWSVSSTCSFGQTVSLY